MVWDGLSTEAKASEASEQPLPEMAFSRADSRHEKLLFLLRYAIRAPSPLNTQPWLFRATSKGLELLLDATRALPRIDPAGREMTASCGALLFALELAGRYFGYRVDTQLLLEPGTVRIAHIALAEKIAPTMEERTLFRAIDKQSSNSAGVDPTMLPGTLLEGLAARAVAHGAWFRYADTHRSWRALIGLVCEADRRQHADALVRADLEHWTRTGPEPFADGIHEARPSACERFVRLVAPRESRVSRTAGKPLPHRLVHEAMPAPVFAVLGTEGDTPHDWIAAGRAFMHLILHASDSGATLTELDQPLQVTALRPLVRGAVAANGFAQQLVRIDRNAQHPTMPRRPLEDMLLSPAARRSAA